MRELTKKQRSAYELRNSGMTFTEVGREMNCRRQEAQVHFKGAEKKIKIMEHERLMGTRTNSTEHLNPEAAAQVIDCLSSEVVESLEALARDVGLPVSTVNALKKRLETKYLPLKLELGKVRTDEFQKGIDGTAKWILDSVDEFDLLRATLKDKVSSFCMLMEKRQLLAGEPTQILSMNERKEMLDLIPLLMKEATRRGVIIDIDPATGEAIAT